MEKKISIKKNFIYNTAYQLLNIIIPLITAPYISRVLDAETIGIQSVANSVSAYFILLAALGTSSYGTREIAACRNDIDKRSKLFWEIELLKLFISAICLIVWFVVVAFAGEYKIYYLILSLNIVRVMLDISWLYGALERYQILSTINFCVRLVATAATFVFVKGVDDLAVYMLIIVLSFVIGNLIPWFFLKEHVKFIPFSQLAVFSHFKETLVYFVPAIATSIYNVLDKIMLGAITHDTAENGYYEQTEKIVEMMKSIVFSMNTVLSARMSFYWANKKYEQFREMLNRGICFVLFISIPMAVGVISIADNFVPMFYGSGYDKVVILLKMYAPLVVVIGLSNALLNLYIVPIGRRRDGNKAVIIGAVVNLVTNIFFISVWQSVGAVITSIFAELIILCMYVVYAGKYLDKKDILATLIKVSASSAGMFVLVRSCSYIFDKSWLLICVQICAGAVCYVLLSLILRESIVYTGWLVLKDKLGFIRGKV